MSDTPATSPAPATAPATDASASTGGDVPAWAKALQESLSKLAVQTDKRFEGIAERIRSGGKDPKQAEAQAANAAAPVSQADLDASIRFGELRGSLPEAQRAQLEALRQDGLGFAQLVRVAEGFKAALPANGSQTAGQTAPPGVAANAAPSTAPRFPATQAELLALKTSNRAAYDAVWAHPDFDVKRLPPR